MASFRKRSRSYRRNTRRKYIKARKSRIKKRGKKLLVGGVQDEAGQAWWNNEMDTWDHTKVAKEAQEEAATAEKKEIEDKQVDEVIAAFNISREDAINVVEIMKEGHEMSDANNIYRNRLRSRREFKEILKKQAELKAAKEAAEAAEAKKHRWYRLFFGKPYVTPDLWHDPNLHASMIDRGTTYHNGGRIRRKSKTNGRKPITHKIKNLKKFNI